MATNRESYETPGIRVLKFKEDILTTSDPGKTECGSWGEGDNAAPPDCDVEITTDNSLNV